MMHTSFGSRGVLYLYIYDPAGQFTVCTVL
jgi:hypothetical protein